MTEIKKLSPEFNSYMLQLNLPIIAQLQMAGLQIALARGQVGDFAREAVVMIFLDHEAKVVYDSAADLISMVKKLADKSRAPLPPN